MLGEIGTSDPIANDELKVLRAAGAAAALTGASINVHQTLGRHGTEIVEVLADEGVCPDRVVLRHMDDDLDPAYQLAPAQTGAVLGFDTFGHESYHHADRRYPTDFERLDAIRSLLEGGTSNRSSSATTSGRREPSAPTAAWAMSTSSAAWSRC